MVPLIVPTTTDKFLSLSSRFLGVRAPSDVPSRVAGGRPGAPT